MYEVQMGGGYKSDKGDGALYSCPSHKQFGFGPENIEGMKEFIEQLPRPAQKAMTSLILRASLVYEYMLTGEGGGEEGWKLIKSLSFYGSANLYMRDIIIKAAQEEV